MQPLGQLCGPERLRYFLFLHYLKHMLTSLLEQPILCSFSPHSVYYTSTEDIGTRLTDPMRRSMYDCFILTAPAKSIAQKTKDHISLHVSILILSYRMFLCSSGQPRSLYLAPADFEQGRPCLCACVLETQACTTIPNYYTNFKISCVTVFQSK